jgi:hypothetical protein
MHTTHPASRAAHLGALALVVAALAAACADTSYKTTDAKISDAADAGGEGKPELDWGSFDVPPLPDGFELGKSVVYAHDAKALYEVDPETLAVTKVADFVWPAAADKMTDLAVDQSGRMIGVSGGFVYAVDPKTGACTELSQLPAETLFVGLSFIAQESGGPEILVGIDKTGGRVDRIDPQSGQTTTIGTFGKRLLASGDIVSVKGLGTVATVIDGESETDFLARVDTSTGEATLIGDTGFSKIFGLGYWKGKLYAFTTAGEFVLLDVKTGAGTLVQADTGIVWWGAGVTTSAPVID